MEKSFETSARHTQILRSDVSGISLVANDEKSIWAPTQNITWLGLTSIDGALAIALHRKEKLISTLNRVLNILFRNTISHHRWPDYVDRTCDWEHSPGHITLSDIHSLRGRLGHTFRN